MIWYSIREQEARLRDVYPSFRLTSDVGLYGTFEGYLTPITQKYRIWIRYVPHIFLDEVTLKCNYVTVKVLDPLIAPNARGTGELTPHVYRYRQPIDRPALCAWDPGDEPFNPTHFIADDIIPAVIRWLVFFEDWLDTGVWRGGGKHPDPDATSAAMSSSSMPSPQVPTAASSLLADELTMVMGSATSMLAIGRASLGRFPSVLNKADMWHLELLGRRLKL
ncbi:hypothetical protein DFI02_1173 [Rhizobium sp. PP-F2F-G20b]|nr:hypothetical protein DFI02_1173 [Rhizobium sp. PP-F2F-G20b]